jgi:polyprenyl-phospho-N-acetylgalactosaminyl synthase
VPVARNDTWVVIPAYNEARSLGAVVAEVVAAGYPVIAVDDGSTDETASAARSAGARVLRHVVNRGQGAALQTGLDHALRCGARHLVTFDADGQHAAEDIPRLVAALEEGADVALGSRFLGRAEGLPRRRRLMLRCAVAVSNRLSGLPLSDAHCGIRAVRAAAVAPLRITQDRMAHASELLRKIKTSGLRVIEVPVTVRYTPYSRAKGQSGFEAVRILFDYFFRPC